jgi:ubiquinone/menaquinone biosynthesis C-methylase UbiE
LQRLFWNGHARNWDALYSGSEIVAHYREVAMWLAEATVPAARVLDVGCGTGNHGIALGELGFEVVGVDFAHGMLARASEKAVQRGVRIELRELDVSEGLPFDDGSFDAVLGSYVLQVVGEPIDLLREVRRVMRPGGVVLVEVPVRRATRAKIVTSPASRLFWTAKVIGSRLPGLTHGYDRDRLRHDLGCAGLALVEERFFARSSAALARR